MRPFVATVAATAGGPTYSPAYVVDNYSNPCNIGVGVVVAGSALYTVQHTFANPFLTNVNTNTSVVWINNDVLASASVNDDTNYAFPPTAIRLALSSAASAQAIFTIIQSGPN